MMPILRLLRRSAFFLLAAILLIFLLLFLKEQLLPSRVVSTRQETALGGSFTLVNQEGKVVSEATYHGQWLLVFFGFTHCPDMCPTGLATMTAAINTLSPLQQQQITPLFISVDPERDTPATLKDYLSSFHPRFQGLTGSAADLKNVTTKYRVYYAREKGKQNKDVNHSGLIYLMKPDGAFQQFFNHSDSADTVGVALQQAIKPAHDQAR
jgi:protein SCO1